MLRAAGRRLPRRSGGGKHLPDGALGATVPLRVGYRHGGAGPAWAGIPPLGAQRGEPATFAARLSVTPLGNQDDVVLCSERLRGQRRQKYQLSGRALRLTMVLGYGLSSKGPL